MMKLNSRENESTLITLLSGVRKESKKKGARRAVLGIQVRQTKESLVNQSQKLTGVTALLEGQVRFHLFHFCVSQETMQL